jgi:formamidopyrimidine-DNA glycosylase
VYVLAYRIGLRNGKRSCGIGRPGSRYSDNVPELPEVETVASGLNKRIAGDTIESVWIGEKLQPLKSPAALIVSTLEGKRIVRVHRAGKHIIIDLQPSSKTTKRTPGPKAKVRQATSLPKTSGKVQWIVHLGMTGQLTVAKPGSEVAKHTHLIAQLASGREVRFIDPRMFGKLSVHLDGFDPGGIEPLEVTEEQFRTLFRGRKTPIKSALLNQKLLRGVGNIYADEALHRASIRPRRRAASLNRDQLKTLHRTVREVLLEAIKAGGSSISDYVNADGEEGLFQIQHRVYGREGEPCLKCKTPIRRVVIGGRSSHYCPNCQK